MKSHSKLFCIPSLSPLPLLHPHKKISDTHSICGLHIQTYTHTQQNITDIYYEQGHLTNTRDPRRIYLLSLRILSSILVIIFKWQDWKLHCYNKTKVLVMRKLSWLLNKSTWNKITLHGVRVSHFSGMCWYSIFVLNKFQLFKLKTSPPNVVSI